MTAQVQAPPAGMVHVTPRCLIGPEPPFDVYSIAFDGVNEHVSMGNSLHLERDGVFTFSLWFRLIIIGSGRYTFLSKREPSGNFRGYEIYYNGEDSFRFFLTNAISSNEIDCEFKATSKQYNDNRWHNLVWTYDGSSSAAGVKCYIDGVAKTVTIKKDTLTATIWTNRNFTVGSLDGTSSFFKGYLDEVSLWITDLTPAQVTELYNGGRPTNLKTHSAEPDLRAWWRMGDGDVYPTISDWESGVTGTMINMEAGDIVIDAPPSPL